MFYKIWDGIMAVIDTIRWQPPDPTERQLYRTASGVLFWLPTILSEGFSDAERKERSKLRSDVLENYKGNVIRMAGDEPFYNVIELCYRERQNRRMK